jgi:hypothetical protein
MADRPSDDSTPGNPDVTRAQSSRIPGRQTIGAYRLLERVGEGGMGEVWLAEQTQPIHRQVALKVIKAGMGMDTAQVVARHRRGRYASNSVRPGEPVHGSESLAGGRAPSGDDARHPAPDPRRRACGHARINEQPGQCLLATASLRRRRTAVCEGTRNQAPPSGQRSSGHADEPAQSGDDLRFAGTVRPCGAALRRSAERENASARCRAPGDNSDRGAARGHVPEDGAIYAESEDGLLTAARSLNADAGTDQFHAQGAAVNIVKQLVELYEASGEAQPSRRVARQAVEGTIAEAVGYSQQAV